MGVMTDQFVCCTTGASGKSSLAARAVLVDGMSRQNAQASHGLTAQAVSQAIGRVLRRDSQIKRAYLIDNEVYTSLIKTAKPADAAPTRVCFKSQG